jgi:serine protease Do
MDCSRFGLSIPRILLSGALAAVLTGFAFAGDQKKEPAVGAESTLVRVTITIVSSGDPQPAEIAGRQLPNYRPKIIETFPSTGVVFDDKSHILTFLGYSWVDCQSPNPQIEVLTASGRKCRAKLIGIDQSIGVAVVRCLGGEKLGKTPFCLGCEIRDGATIVTPMQEPAGVTQFRRAQIVSVGRGNEPLAGREGWVITVNRPLPGIGEPILDTAHRILGFVAGQSPSQDGPNGTEAVVFLMPQLLSSAQKILRAGGDIQTGWLGVFVDPRYSSDMGVIISNVSEGSPAEKAGLCPQDVMTTWNGKPIEDARHFIQMVQDTPIGSRVTLNLVRQGRSIETAAVIEARKPEPKPSRLAFDLRNFVNLGAAAETFQSDAPLSALMAGIALVPLTPQLADFLDIPGQSGLLVSSVDANTPFSRAGVLAGDVIVAADGKPILDPSALLARLKSLVRKGTSLSLKLLRKGTERSATIESPAGSKP